MKKLVRTKPMVINKNLGSVLKVRPEDLTTSNDDNEMTVIPTDKQKYEFDRNGWILFPGLLAHDEIREMGDSLPRFGKILKAFPNTNAAGWRAHFPN